MANILNSGQTILTDIPQSILGAIAKGVTAGRGAPSGGGMPVLESWAYCPPNGTSQYTTITAVAPAGIQAGDKLILMLMDDDDATPWPNPHWTLPAGWDRELSIGLSGTIAAGSEIFSKVADGTETDFVVTQATSEFQYGWWARISGGGAINTSSTMTSDTNTLIKTIPALITTVDNCLCLYGLAFDGSDGLPFALAASDWAELDEGSAGTASSGSRAGGCWGYRDMPSAGDTGAVVITPNVQDGAAGWAIAIAPA